MSEATEAEGEIASPARTLRPEFTGSGGEYFRVGRFFRFLPNF